jgi:hypothetical protein
MYTLILPAISENRCGTHSPCTHASAIPNLGGSTQLHNEAKFLQFMLLIGLWIGVSATVIEACYLIV